MATGNIRNPDDAANTGPRERTRTFTEDAVTKHVPSVEVIDNRIRTGVYFVHSGALVVQAAAHGAGAGWMWVVNHVGATSELGIRRVRFMAQHGSALATPTSPRIALERFTFTGTPSGAQITAAKRRTGDATPSTWSARTANTGMTQTAGAVVRTFLPVVALTAVGACNSTWAVWEPDYDEVLVLDAGEGLRVYQPDAGTTADTRRFTLDWIIEEFTEF